MAAQRSLKDKADEWLAAEGLEANAIFRVSRSIAEGLLQIVRGENATLVISEWHFEGLDRASEAGRMLSHSPAPVLLVRGAVEPFARLVIVARREDVIGSELARSGDRSAAGDTHRARSSRGLRRRASGLRLQAIPREGGRVRRTSRERRCARLGPDQREGGRPPHVLRDRRCARGVGALPRARSASALSWPSRRTATASVHTTAPLDGLSDRRDRAAHRLRAPRPAERSRLPAIRPITAACEFPPCGCLF